MVGKHDDDGYQRQDQEFKTLPCVESAQVEVSECMALVIFILNILFGGLGTFISGFIDGKGINCSAICVGIL